ncbi:hypothetical protein [Glycomyces buryatensis]|uniref:Helix-hairpin-helix domain-containing protein n=1 Tax=Glycomyces buryatensis TaxID=2570927 RepID=A0A4S8QGC4_9ACTN|nr:hypothetical protein [Glycomyces buryatensis]THV39704.1 hypothetical protein FAB82_17150 [Glycomyces buryatensis]
MPSEPTVPADNAALIESAPTDSRPGAASVWWALLPILLPGLGAPIAFGVATSRRPAPGTVIPLIAYTAAFFGFCVPAANYGSDMVGWLNLFAALSALTATVGACGHLFAIRNRVWGAEKQSIEPSPDPTNRAALDHALRLRDKGRQTIEKDPMLAKRIGIGRPDLPRDIEDGGLIDLNHVPVEILRDLPGFTDATAKQVHDRVEHVGPYQDFNEVIVEIGIPTGFERVLREYVVLIP